MVKSAILDPYWIVITKKFFAKFIIFYNNFEFIK